MASTSSKRVGVVLAGCGFLDGAEIHEATLTLLSLDRRGATAVPMAPDIEQLHVVNHAAGEPSAGERRNVLREAARISRGEIQDLSQAHARELDALVFPGGYGAAKNLCTFAVDGVALKVNPEVERLVKEMRAAQKPMGFICIAPVIAAKLLGAEHPELTIGVDPDTAQALQALGAKHLERKVDDIAVDRKLKLVSTPAYMLGPSIAPVAAGIDKLVSALLEMA
ncbi:MAG: isoprenoid biosynthesis glyoxalase ElbB [Myxococcales bacterium]|nr:isoprenoid biosynthesis glyoxalase ElbB [Myxococcales bacterium]